MNTVTSPITLTSGQLVINKNLTIQGPGANLLNVHSVGFVQGEVRRVIFVGNVAAAISGLTISGGYNRVMVPVSQILTCWYL
jgi:hypothetical protein